MIAPDTVTRRVENEAELMALLEAEFRQRSSQTVGVKLTQAGMLHSEAIGAASRVQKDALAQTMPIANVHGAPPNDSQRGHQAPHTGEHSLDLLRAWHVPQATIDSLVCKSTVPGGSKPQRAA